MCKTIDWTDAKVDERLTWSAWMDIEAPYEDCTVEEEEVVTRFEANGMVWDIHGTLYKPAVDRMPSVAFFLTHGGAGSEREFHETPDGRPGLAMVLARQGFRSLAVSYVGHYPKGGQWTVSAEERWPDYLLDAELDLSEILERNLRCTFDVHVEGMALLADQHLAGRNLIAFGHSTAGPMTMTMPDYLKSAKVTGILGWGTVEPNLWTTEWTRWFEKQPPRVFPVDSFARRNVENFRAARYEDHPDLCPWGSAEEYFVWGDKFKSQFKTSLCDNQNLGNIDIMYEYAERTGLSPDAYLKGLRDPDAEWLSRTSVLMLAGENDSILNAAGRFDVVPDRQTFISHKFSIRAARTKSIIVPRYGHFGFVGIHNEKIAYLWLDALAKGYFDPRK